MTSDLRRVSTVKEFLTIFVRVYATFWLLSDWRQRYALLSISLRDIYDIHCSLGVLLSGSVGLSISFGALKIVSTRLFGPVSSASWKAHFHFRHPRGIRYVVIVIFLRGKSGRVQKFVGLGCLFS